MKHSIYIIATMLLALLSSCSDEELSGSGNNSDMGGTKTLNFTLSIDAGDGLSVGTRASSGKNIIPIPSDYRVYVYWFKGKLQGSVVKYYFEEANEVSSSHYSRNVDIEGKYAYLFLAVPKSKGYDNVIELNNMRDFGQAHLEDYGAIKNSGSLIKEISNLDNCFLPFLEEDVTEKDNYDKTEFKVTRNLQIFGDGNYITAGYDEHFPASIVLRRQFGAVEIQGTSTLQGKQVKCSVKSDYYRLYFSQMIKPTNSASISEDGYYESQNNALDASGYASSDYFSLIFQKENFVPSITYNQETNGDFLTEKGNLLIYLPYTEARRNGPAGEGHTTLYSWSNGGSINGPSLTVTIDGREYKYNDPFPIRRNTKAFFYIEGTELHFSGKDGNGGIDLDDDKWDGVATN